MINSPLGRLSVHQLKRAVAIREQVDRLGEGIGTARQWPILDCETFGFHKEGKAQRGDQSQNLCGNEGQVGEDQGAEGQKVIASHCSGLVGAGRFTIVSSKVLPN